MFNPVVRSVQTIEVFLFEVLSQARRVTKIQCANSFYVEDCSEFMLIR